MIGTPSHRNRSVTPSRVYVLNRQMYVSEDAGKSFTKTTLSIRLDYLAVAAGRVYVGSLNQDIYRVRRWRQDSRRSRFHRVRRRRMHTIGADPFDDEVLYACIEGVGTYKTVDHGGPRYPRSPCQPVLGTIQFFAPHLVSPANRPCALHDL